MASRDQDKLQVTSGAEEGTSSKVLLASDLNLPRVLIHQKAKDYKASAHTGWSWGSFKYDGIRGITTDKLLTREGHPFKGLEAIEREALDTMARAGFTFMDGELDIPGMTFQEKQSIILSGSVPQEMKDKVIYRVFAAGTVHKRTEDMIESLWLALRGCVRLEAVIYNKVKPEQVEAVLASALAAGAEGLMLRDPWVPYAEGETDALYKLKPVKEDDFTIIDTYEGKGHISGMLGGVVVENMIDGQLVRSRVGTGFDKYGEHGREGLWARRDELIGLAAEIHFKGVTTKANRQGFFSLREPVYGRLKLDRPAPVGLF